MRFFLFLAAMLAATSARAEGAMGLWATQPTNEGYLEIRIQPCGSGLCGTIENARDLDGVSGPYDHQGRQMIWHMQPAGEGLWNGGKIWDPRNGRTFNAKMELSGNRLKVSGCVLGFCDGQDWTRVE